MKRDELFFLFFGFFNHRECFIYLFRYRDDKELVLTDDHYEGGITEQTALTVKNATPSDMGTYKCVLENNVAASTSEDVVQVSVLCEYFEISQYDLKIQNHMYIYIYIYVQKSLINQINQFYSLQQIFFVNFWISCNNMLINFPC